jgi:hypothetical protein
MDLTKASSWAGIIATLLALAALVVAIFPSEAHDYAVKKLHAVQHTPPTPEQKPDPGPTPLAFTPPDLEGHKWSVHIRALGFPAFESMDSLQKGAQTPFLADHTYVVLGMFLVPTLAVDQHIDCPSGVQGHWHYANADHSQLTFDMEIQSIGGRTHDEYLQCSQTLSPIATARTRVSGTCTFSSPQACTASNFEIHLSPLQ